jgi:NACHT domain-containing protein
VEPNPPPQLTDLERFANVFNSEDVLRNAIETLLTKLPNVSGVQPTHGPQEYGKDIVFYGAGGLSEVRLYACVVKNTRITGAVDSASGARTVFLQAQQSFDTPFVNAKGDDERVEHVYVICPHELSQTTRNSVSGALKQGQVTFLCGRELLELFEKYWPDFLVFDSDLLPAYLKSLRSALDENAALGNIFFQNSVLGEVSGSLSKVYVRPHFFQDLQEFHFVDGNTTAQISAIESSKLSLQQVKDLGSSLVGTSNILDTMSADKGATGQETRRLAAQLRSIARQIRSAWDEAYKPFKVKNVAPAGKGRLLRLTTESAHDEALDHSARKREMELSLVQGELLSEQCRSLVQSAAPLIGEFRSRVERANVFVRENSCQDHRVLQMPAYKLYCGVQENSRLNPVELVPRPIDRSLEFKPDLLAKHSGSLLITGPAGLGKTSFCKWNTLADGERFVKGESTVFPVFVPLHQFAQGDLGSFEDTFLQTPEIRALVRSKNDENKTFRLRFYLDGLDEIPSVDRQHELLELARTFMLSQSNVDLIVTSREHVFGLGWLPRVRLRELDSEGITELVNKWLDHDKADVKEFFDQLAAVGSSLGRLMGTPLVATLIIAVYRKNRKLPESKVRLYKIFVELLSGGWDYAKGLKRETRFGTNVKLSVLGHLATLLHFQRRRDFKESVFRVAVEDTITLTIPQWDLLLNELVQDCLLARVGSSYSFSHQSFQEYFAAQDICDPSGQKQTKVLKWFLKGEDWWREVLSFFLGSSANPEDLKRWVANAAEDVASVSASDLFERQKYLEAVIDEYFPVID